MKIDLLTNKLMHWAVGKLIYQVQSIDQWIDLLAKNHNLLANKLIHWLIICNWSVGYNKIKFII